MATNLIDTGCTECFEVVLPRCPETITIDSDFTPDEILTLEIEDLYGNKYRIEPMATYAGSVVFSMETLPEGLLWSGVFTFRLFQAVTGYFCDVPRLICGEYYCASVTFENVDKEARICCDEGTGSICCPNADILLLPHDEILTLDLTSETQCETVIVIQDSGTLNLPNISDVGNQDMRVIIIPGGGNPGTLIGNPGATDSIEDLGVGVQSIGNVFFGGYVILTIENPHRWNYQLVIP